MCQELITLAEEFARYRRGKKQVKYPKAMWEKATPLCERHPMEKVASSLGVSLSSIRRQLRSKGKRGNTSAHFAPITIAPNPSVQLHVRGPLPVTIEFDRSTEELAQLILALCGGVSC